MSIRTFDRIMLGALSILCALVMEMVAHAVPAYGESLTLTWTDNSDNEDGFKIERKLGQTGTFGAVGQVGADVVTYVDGAVPDDQLYCYQVNAFNASGSSPWSGEACGRDTDVIFAPGTPVVTKTVTTTTTTTTTIPVP